MKALLDTCVLSEIGKVDGNASVVSLVAALPSDHLFVSVLTIGEIAKGVALMALGARRIVLESWLVEVETFFDRRMLDIDLETARIWGEMTARAQKSGITIPTADGLLAATAMRHGLHVLTRNTRRFEATGALILDPWQGP